MLRALLFILCVLIASIGRSQITCSQIVDQNQNEKFRTELLSKTFFKKFVNDPSKVEMAAVDTTFTVDFPAIASWGFRMSQADSLVRRKPDMPVLAVMGLDSESAMPGFRETQRFLMNWFPQAERCGIMNATHGLQSMNPVAVGEGAHAFLKKHPMI